MLLVDTSAWIDFFKGREPVSDYVDQALEDNQAAICGPVITELSRGFRSASERKKILNLLSGCRNLSQPDRLWEDAGRLGLELKTKGRTIKTVDLLIATYALAHSIPVLTKDKDFHLIRKGGFRLEVIIP